MRSITPKITGFSTLKMHEPDVPLQVALTTTRVKRPLPPDHPAIEVAMSTIKWDPSQRIDAATGAKLTGTARLTDFPATEASTGLITPTGHAAHSLNQNVGSHRKSSVGGAQIAETEAAAKLACAVEAVPSLLTIYIQHTFSF